MNFSDGSIQIPELTVNEGIVNFLPSAVVAGDVILSVNNPNTAAGTAVTVNLQRSEFFEALDGTIAIPSTGTNTATVNLIGTGTNLRIALHRVLPFSYSGDIAGEGSVSVITPTFGSSRKRLRGTTPTPEPPLLTAEPS